MHVHILYTTQQPSAHSPNGFPSFSAYISTFLFSLSIAFPLWTRCIRSSVNRNVRDIRFKYRILVEVELANTAYWHPFCSWIIRSNCYELICHCAHVTSNHYYALRKLRIIENDNYILFFFCGETS